MTESSSKGLTWATFLAGVVSALLLAAIGCVKPLSASDVGNRLPSAEGVGGQQQRYISPESIRRTQQGPSSLH